MMTVRRAVHEQGERASEPRREYPAAISRKKSSRGGIRRLSSFT